MRPLAPDGQRQVKRIGLDADDHAPDVGCHRRRGSRVDLDGGARRRPDGVDSGDDTGNGYIANDQQPRRPAQIDSAVVDRGERARQKLDGDQQTTAGARDWCGQGHDTAVDRRDRLSGGQHDRAAAIGHGDAAGRRVFRDRHLKQRRDIVQRDQFLTADASPSGLLAVRLERSA